MTPLKRVMAFGLFAALTVGATVNYKPLQF